MLYLLISRRKPIHSYFITLFWVVISLENSFRLCEDASSFYLIVYTLIIWLGNDLKTKDSGKVRTGRRVVEDRIRILNEIDRSKWWVKVNEMKFNKRNSGGCVIPGEAARWKGSGRVLPFRREEMCTWTRLMGCVWVACSAPDLRTLTSQWMQRWDRKSQMGL